MIIIILIVSICCIVNYYKANGAIDKYEEYSHLEEISNSVHGDLDEEKIKYIIDKSIQHELDPKIIFTLIFSESSFNSQNKSKNSNESASGYGAITRDAASFVIVNLNKGQYDYSFEEHRQMMTSNWKLNIDITVQLFDHYYDLYDSDKIFNAFSRYHGGSTENNRKYYDAMEANHKYLFGTGF